MKNNDQGNIKEIVVEYLREIEEEMKDDMNHVYSPFAPICYETDMVTFVRELVEKREDD